MSNYVCFQRLCELIKNMEIYVQEDLKLHFADSLFNFQNNNSVIESINYQPISYLPQHDIKTIPSISSTLIDLHADLYNATPTALPLNDDLGIKISPYYLLTFDFQNVHRNMFISHNDDNNLSGTCFLIYLEHLARPSYHNIGCYSEMIIDVILCEEQASNDLHVQTTEKPKPTQVMKKENLFQCPLGPYISIINVCNGIRDCPDFPYDEIKCIYIVNGVMKTDSSYFIKTCHHANCTCPYLYQQKLLGGCQIYFQNTLKHYTNQENKSIFHCSNTTRIHLSLVDDLIFDCANRRDEPFLLQMNVIKRPRFNCLSKSMLECFPGHKKCYYEHQKCQYIISHSESVLTICRNGKHLDNCDLHQCKKTYKCRKSYCIPYPYICNGKWDCWDGSDELDCKFRFCNGLFKCKDTSACIPLSHVCDGLNDCPLQDDEIVCTICPLQCLCLGLAVSCTYSDLIVNKQNLNSYIFVHISNTHIIFLSQINNTVILILTNNSLSRFAPFIEKSNLRQVKTLNLEHNKLTTLFHKIVMKRRQFALIELDISHNLLSTIENYDFKVFSNLLSLDLSSNKISILKAFSFHGIHHLKVLKLLDNIISTISTQLFKSLSINIILTRSHQVCCVAQDIKMVCTTVSKYCKRLLENKYIFFSVWILGIGIIVFNIISLSYSLNLLYFKKKKIQQMAQVYRILIIIMNISDLVLGLYLMILTISDAIITDTMVEIIGFWRKSFYCLIVSNISLLAMNFSLLSTFLISLSRFLAVNLNCTLSHHNLRLMLSIFAFVNVFLVTGMYYEQYYSRKSFKMTSLCFLFRDLEGLSVPITDTIIPSFFIFLTAGSLLLYTAILFTVVRSSKKVGKIYGSKSKSIAKYFTIVYMSNTIWYFSASVSYLTIILSPTNTSFYRISYYVTLFVIPLCSLINPLIYNLSDIIEQKKIKNRI